MLALFLTVMCSTSIVLILKKNEVQRGNILVLLFGNYLVAAGISAGFYWLYQDASSSWTTFFFGGLLALPFVGSFFAFARAVAIAGTALAAVTSRLSVFVPVVLSILVFGELPKIHQAGGIALTLVTFYLFYRSLAGDHKRALHLTEWLFLLVLFLGIGVNDFSMKLFEEWRPIQEKPFFLTMIFGCSALYTGVLVYWRRLQLNSRAFRLGLVLGVPNVFSSFFLLEALRVLPAVAVFPAVNIGIIVLSAIAAFVIWRERLSRYGQWAAVVGIVAISLLTV